MQDLAIAVFLVQIVCQKRTWIINFETVWTIWSNLKRTKVFFVSVNSTFNSQPNCERPTTSTHTVLANEYDLQNERDKIRD